MIAVVAPDYQTAWDYCHIGGMVETVWVVMIEPEDLPEEPLGGYVYLGGSEAAAEVARRALEAASI